MHLERRRRNVFYAAPAFNKVSEINKAFFSNTIVDNSVFVRPSSIGSLPDNKEHNVIFQPYSNIGYFCSNPKKIDIYNNEYVTHYLLNSLIEVDYIENNNSLIELAKELLMIASDVMGEEWSAFAKEYLTEIPNKPVQAVAYFSKLLFNSDFFLINIKY